ncbi:MULTISPECIES: hypothetical protein [Sphingomonas]|uniref:Uncharacterized protein n=1 Tax=Sphingomonas kyungheensis TaxID=1069987 RepID=A0ABU8GY84_9SPHN|nr:MULTISPECIES: hypothetical protein [unclassified Sphingomonas]EZP53502.1 hypothetical protein BW41_01904 [Sphingomonas sp. RIT328]
MTWLAEWAAEAALSVWTEVVRFTYRHLGWAGGILATLLPPALVGMALWLLLR